MYCADLKPFLYRRSAYFHTVKSHQPVFLSRFFLSTSVQLKCQPVRTARYLFFPTHKLDSSFRSVSIWKSAPVTVSLFPRFSEKTFMTTFYTPNSPLRNGSHLAISQQTTTVLISHVNVFIFLWMNLKIFPGDTFRPLFMWNVEDIASPRVLF